MFARITLTVVSLVAVCLLLSSPSLGQPGGGGFGKGGGGDPKKFFDMLAQGGNEIIISKQFMMKDGLVKFAEKHGITNDKITFEQFKLYTEERNAERKAKGGDGKSWGGGGNPGGGSADGKSRFKGMGATASKEPEKKEPAKKELDKKEPEHSRNDPNATPGVVTKVYIDDDNDRMPVVFRAGKLPKELPEWFEHLDTNKDGQVDLGEWLAAKKPVAEFKAMDLNDDGLLTADEVLHFMSKGSSEKTVSTEDGTQASRAPADGTSFFGNLFGGGTQKPATGNGQDRKKGGGKRGGFNKQ